jgi:hypothetical protein
VFEQALEHTYPAAPQIDSEVRLADLRTVHELCAEALEAPDRRIPQVPTADRRIMARIANPLRLGVQSEQAFVLDVSQRWETHFTRKLAERTQSGAEGHVTVAELRRWIDEPAPMGLSKDLQNLVLIVWAAATDRVFTDHGGPARVSIDGLADHYEVVAQELPDAGAWAEAIRRAERVLGLAGLPAEPSAVALAKLSNGLARMASEHLEGVEALPGELGTLAGLLEEDGAARIKTAEHALAMLRAVATAGNDLDKVRTFLSAELLPSPEAIGASIKSAEAVTGTIAGIDTALLAAAMARDEGAEIGEQLRELLASDELVVAFAPQLRTLADKARSIVFVERPSPPAPMVPAPAPDALVSDTGLNRDAALERLEEIRTRIRDGELGDGPFAIEIRSVGTPNS